MALSRLSLEEFEQLAPRWDALLGEHDSPFVSAAWLSAYWRVLAPDDGVVLALMDGDGLLAGGCFREHRRGASLISPTNAHSNDWDVVAVDDAAAGRLWREVLATGEYRRLRLDAVPGDHGHGAAAHEAISAAGFRLVAEELPPSPWTTLPPAADELLKSRSRNLRSQVGRRRRALEKEGELSFRTTIAGPEMEPDLERFLELEASGWKGRDGSETAIALDPDLKTMYREFAKSASAAGHLRLYLLELDGEVIAADLGCVQGGCGYLVKTAFQESLSRFAPGLVLRAEVLRASIEEGLDRYDFLGGPDDYKMRWTDQVRPRATLRAYRGVRGAPAYAWRSSLRPRLKRARDHARRTFPPGRKD